MGKGITRKLKKMIKNKGKEIESPKPQRAIKKATRKFTTPKRSRSMFDYFSTYTQSSLNLDLDYKKSEEEDLNNAILLSPSQNLGFEFSVPPSGGS